MKLKMDGICKSFGSNEVLKSVGFQLSEGEICALLGENGAGKSTLMNILGGVLQPDSGEILLDGQKRKFDSPAQSLDAGIAFIHQELNLINDLPIYENMFIGRELKKKNGLLDHKRMIEETRRVFERMGLTLDPKEMVRNLDASYKQIVEISRALLMNAKMIIMDEPTSYGKSGGVRGRVRSGEPRGVQPEADGAPSGGGEERARGGVLAGVPDDPADQPGAAEEVHSVREAELPPDPGQRGSRQDREDVRMRRWSEA